MSEENAISKLLYLAAGEVKTQILANGGFEAGSLNGWRIGAGTPSITTSSVFDGNYSVVLNANDILYQYFEPMPASELIMGFHCCAVNDDGEQLLNYGFILESAAGNYKSDAVVTGSTWAFNQFHGTNSYLNAIAIIFWADATNIGPIYIDQVYCRHIHQRVMLDTTNLISSGAMLATVGAKSGSLVIKSGSNPLHRIKVYDAGYTSNVTGLHYFYFGSTTGSSSKRFCTHSGSGTIHQSFPNPRIGDLYDNVYLWSDNTETNIPFDISFITE